jgi:tetratricopeptide (TPR) repeat protein
MPYCEALKSSLDPFDPDLLLSQPDVSAGRNTAKQRRPAAGRPAKKAGPIKKAAKAARRQASARSGRAAAKRSSRPLPKLTPKARSKPASKPLPKLTAKSASKVAGKALATKTVRPIEVAPGPAAAPEPTPAPAPKKPSFYEAIAIYESGVRGLQRHDYAGAAESFRQVLQRYPEERELIERARLYLRVCERETAQRPAGPQTTAERVYAATMSLSAGDSDAALGHVQRALDQEPANHRAHYMMAVIHSTRSETDKAVEHLRRAIELNPDSRSLARQDADLERLRESPTVKSLLEEAPGDLKARARARR